MGHSSPPTNCPNCGAPIDPDRTRCAYCGTVYLDLIPLQLHGPSWLRINTGTRGAPRVVTIKCCVREVTEYCPPPELISLDMCESPVRMFIPGLQDADPGVITITFEVLKN